MLMPVHIYSCVTGLEKDHESVETEVAKERRGKIKRKRKEKKTREIPEEINILRNKDTYIPNSIINGRNKKRRINRLRLSQIVYILHKRGNAKGHKFSFVIAALFSYILLSSS